MSDLTTKLMELLADNDSMEKLQNLGNLINTASSKEIDESTQAKKKDSEYQTEQAEENIFSLDSLQTVMKLMPLLSSLNKEDENTRLLCALRPHLSTKRQAKLDESIKMMQLFKLLPILRSQGIF